MQYCSYSIRFYLHHQTHRNWVLFLLWPSGFILSGAISNCPPFFPVAYWTPSDLGGWPSTVISVCFFILSMGVLWQEHWSGLPFPSPLDKVLSELSTTTHLSWEALHSVAQSLIKLCKPWFLSNQTNLKWRHFTKHHEIKRHLLLGIKAMTNLDSILKSRDITLPTRSI